MNITQIANNQFSVRTDKGLYFQSYNSVIAKIDNDNKVTLGKDYRYSRTTMKYLINFLNVDSIKIVDENLKNKTYKLDNNLAIR